MTKKGIYERDYLRERVSDVENMLKQMDKDSVGYRLAMEIRAIYGYLLNDAIKSGR